MTLGSGEIKAHVDTPYGFFPRRMAGFPLGYPVVWMSSLSSADARDLVQYLRDGNFLDEYTRTLSAYALTFNRDHLLFG
jgi:hypothetical protein